MPTCDLSIIIVSWNVRELLDACLQSIERASQPLGAGEPHLRLFGPPDQTSMLEVIVVDNASSDGTVEQVAARFPWVRLIPCQENLGFTAGNNQGYAGSGGRFIYFLNPDTEVDEAGLWRLYSLLRASEDVAVAGPQLRYGDGELQPSARRFPTRLTGFFESTWLGRAWPGNPWARRMHMADWQVDFVHDVDWLVGAAMMCRRVALEEVRIPGMVGPFDEGYFMYSEEVDLCRRLKRAGWRILYVPDAHVIHHEGRSSEQVAAARHIYFNTSKVRYYGKVYGRRWANLLRRYLLLEFRQQLWLERIKLILGSRRDLRRQRIAAYTEVLASRLRPREW